MCFKIKEMHQAINISKANKKDVVDILNIQSIVWPLLYTNKKENITKKEILESMSPNSKKSKTLWEKVIKENKDSIGDSLTLVAKNESNTIGFGYAVKDRDFGEIRSLYILPQYQCAGIGSRLLSKMIEWLGRESNIILSVAEYAEQAISFYKRFGFEITNKTSYQELKNNKKIPEIEMVLYKL